MKSDHHDLGLAGPRHNHRAGFHFGDFDIVRRSLEHGGRFQAQVLAAQTFTQRILGVPAGQLHLRDASCEPGSGSRCAGGSIQMESTSGRRRRTEAVENDQAGVRAWRILGDAAIHGARHADWLRASDAAAPAHSSRRRPRASSASGSSTHGAVVGGKRVARQQPRFEQPGGARPIFEQRFLLGSRRQRRASACPTGAPPNSSARFTVRGFDAVVPHGNKNLPDGRDRWPSGAGRSCAGRSFQARR